MHGFIKRFADGVFYPEEVEILVATFDDAWARLQASQHAKGTSVGVQLDD